MSQVGLLCCLVGARVQRRGRRGLAWGAGNVVFVVGAQKLVPDRAAGQARIYEHCFKLEDARALEAYGKNSRVGKILEVHREDPGRVHVVLIRRRVGF